MDWQSDQIVALYEAMPGTALRQVLILEYRCPSGCLLLHAWNTPDGRMWFRPRNRLSTHVANDLGDAARIHRTDDGDRTWSATGGSLDELLEFFAGAPEAAGALSMNCHHLRNVDVSCQKLAADADSATPGRPTRDTIRP